jgi:hypothetical protein
MQHSSGAKEGGFSQRHVGGPSYFVDNLIHLYNGAIRWLIPLMATTCYQGGRLFAASAAARKPHPFSRHCDAYIERKMQDQIRQDRAWQAKANAQ